MQSPNVRQPIKNPWIKLKSWFGIEIHCWTAANSQSAKVKTAFDFNGKNELRSKFLTFKTKYMRVYLRDRDRILLKSFTIH